MVEQDTNAEMQQESLCYWKDWKRGMIVTMEDY